MSTHFENSFANIFNSSTTFEEHPDVKDLPLPEVEELEVEEIVCVGQ